jgi:hypothetical protein
VGLVVCVFVGSRIRRRWFDHTFSVADVRRERLRSHRRSLEPVQPYFGRDGRCNRPQLLCGHSRPDGTCQEQPDDPDRELRFDPNQTNQDHRRDRCDVSVIQMEVPLARQHLGTRILNRRKHVVFIRTGRQIRDVRSKQLRDPGPDPAGCYQLKLDELLHLEKRTRPKSKGRENARSRGLLPRRQDRYCHFPAQSN